MSTFEFISQYLGSPIVAHRNRALICLLQEAMSNPEVVNQIGLNLQSKNLDIVTASLKVLLALGLRDPIRVKPLSKKIINLGRRTNHFEIASLCKDILINLKSIIPSLEDSANLLSKRLTPKLKQFDDSEGMFYANCDYFIEYALGSQDYKYELSHICGVFRYDCKKAFKQVTRYMKNLGYRKGVKYWKERPYRWKHDFYGNRYETRLQYYARHGIQVFLMWCVKNLPTSIKAWDELLIYERKWDASIPDLSIEERPKCLRFSDLQINVEPWLKKRIKKADAYELLNSKAEWMPLYENTNFRDEDKSFKRYVTTCFIRIPIGKLSRKNEIFPIHYSCRNCYVNELPIEAKKKGWLTLDNSSLYDLPEDKLTPSYGTVSEDFGDYVKLFPAPELVEYFKLIQKKNALEYYKGREPVIRCINWRSGYRREVSSYGEDRFELANYGHLLIIKSKYLKKYLRENNLRLLAVGDIWKMKVKKWGREEYDSYNKNTRRKRVSFEIIKI